MLSVNYINKQTIKQTQRKGDQVVVIRYSGIETRETGRWQSRVITSTYKINKYQGCDVQQNKYYHCCYILNMKVLKGENAEFPALENKSLSIILCLYEMLNVY